MLYFYVFGRPEYTKEQQKIDKDNIKKTKKLLLDSCKKYE